MWTRLLFVVLVAAAAVQAWNPGTGYSYKVQSRTLSALHQVGDQYSGMLMKANLKIYALQSSMLYAKVEQPQYANVHRALPGGWGSYIPEDSLEWENLEMTKWPWIIQLRNGVIHRLIVVPWIPEWELNMIKGIVSQIQVDSKAENYYNSRINDLPSDDSANSVYKTMEDSVTGKCEVLYDISPLPEYVLQSHPQLVPFPSADPEDAKTLDIVKTTNYSHCEKRPAFHHGFSGEDDIEPASSKMGQFFARSSVSRVVVTGRPSNPLIQSSVTTNKVILSPAVYNNQKGMVVSRMNLTLTSIRENEPRQAWEQAEKATLQLNDLVYDINFQNGQQNQGANGDNNQEPNEQGQPGQSSDEERLQGSAARRFRRTPKPTLPPTAEPERERPSSQESTEGTDSQDNSASSEEWYQPKPNMNDAPDFPFLPYFIGYKGESIQKAISGVQKAIEIARDVAKDLQTPQAVPEKATLAKYTILTRLVQTMNAEQLKEATQQIYTSDESTKEAKAWKVFRDAVSQCGTSPALVVMKQWIDTKKVQGWEAAEMIAPLPHHALTPTPEYVQYFFKMATSEVVKSQRHLNTTAILSFTNLVRNAQVDSRSAHNRYPTHTFGRLNPAQAPAVTRDYIPYLAYQLRKAAREGDSVRVQIYVRALGNLAHPKILSVFEPYLEGERQVSDFQRLHMVVALNQMVKIRPSQARAVLYRIYKNVAETPEVRSAAVYLIMKTNPPASMLQRFAESTNNEHSKQVRSAVKTALEHAAALKAPESQQVAENAHASKNALNNTNFGPEYTKIALASGPVPEMNIAFRAGLSAIGSEDHLAPKSTFAHFRQILAGLKREAISGGYMASSTKDLLNLIFAQSSKAYSQPENSQFESEYAQQIEGNLFLKTPQGERFLAFDNTTIEHLPTAINDVLTKLMKGHSYSLQKIYNEQSLTLAFPTATGLPFVYTLTKPTLFSLEGKGRAETTPEVFDWKSVKLSGDAKIQYSSKTEASMGFVTPFNSMYHIAGTDKDAQVYLPIHAQIKVDSVEGSEISRSTVKMTVQPLTPNQDIQIATLRSKAYTAQTKILQLKPSQQKPIYAAQPQQRSITIGKDETGMAFRLYASTEQGPFDYAELYRQFKQRDALAAFASITKEKTIKNYEYTITYDHDKSPAKTLELTTTYGRLDKTPESDPYAYPENQRTKSKGNTDSDDEIVFDENLAIPTNTAPASPERLQEFLSRASETMKIGHARAFDISAEFKGERKSIYIATVAGARSPMQDRFAALVYLRHVPTNGKHHEFAMFPNAQIPYAPLANYEQAIKNKPTAYVDTKISFGENFDDAHSQVYINANLERSSQREQYVRQQPISQFCQQQAGHGNNYLPACQNATLAAGHMDQYEFTVKYARIPEVVKNATYKVYSLARQMGYEYNSEDMFARNAPKKINLNIRFAPNLKSANVSIYAPQMSSEFKNVRLSYPVSAAVVAHPNYKPSELVSRYILGKSCHPTCTIDKSAVNTFNNKTYPLHLEEEWYLVARYVPKKYQQVKRSPASQMPFIHVQTRQSPTNGKEIKIYLGTQDVVEIFPRASGEYPEVKVNNNLYKIKEGELTEVKSKVDNRNFVYFYGLPYKTMRLAAPKYTLDIIYDTTTFVLNVGNEYRSDVRGLCGTFDGETETDFTSPKQCIMKDVQRFIRSYTVTGDGNLKYKDESPSPRDCIYKKFSRGDAVSDYEAGRQLSPLATEQQSSHQSRRCTNFRTKVVEQEGQLCFSLRPLPTCSSQCQPSNLNEKSVAFHCVEDGDVSRNWAKLAARGVSLDVASKGSNKNLTVKVPESCQA